MYRCKASRKLFHYVIPRGKDHFVEERESIRVSWSIRRQVGEVVYISLCFIKAE